MKTLLLILTVLTAFVCTPLRAEPTLAEVDAIFMKLMEGVELPVSTHDGKQREKAYQKLLLEFIYSPKYAALREEYRVAIDQYIEGGVKESLFNEILHALAVKVKRHRDLAKSLMTPSYNGRDFEIAGETKVSGRTVNETAWNAKLDESILALTTKAAPLLRMKPKARLEFVRNSVQLLDKILADDMTALKAKYGETSRAVHKHHGDLILQIKQDPSFKALAAYISLQNLTTPPFRDQLRSGSADVIFYAIEELKSYPEEILKSYSLQDVGGVAALFREPIPDVRKIVDDRKLFPGEKVVTARGKEVDAEKSAGATTFTFRSTPRPFHAIWKGTCYNECVKNRPARFLTAALNGAIFHFVEENGKNKGWTQMIPGSAEDTGIYLSVDFGSSVFNRTLTVRDKQTGELVPANFFDLWVDRVQREGGRYGSLVVGHSTSGDNAGVLGTVRRSAAFTIGTPAMQSSEFVPQDPMALKYGKRPWWKYWDISGYGYNEKRMLYDATIPEAGELIQLAFVRRDSSPSELLNHLLTYSNTPARLRMAVDMVKKSVDPSKFGDLVALMSGYNGSESVRVEGVRHTAGSALPIEVKEKILRDSLTSRSERVEAAGAVGMLELGRNTEEVLDSAMKDLHRTAFHRFMNPSDFEMLLSALESPAVVLNDKQAQEMFDYLLREPPTRLTAKWHERVLNEIIKRWPDHPRTDEVFLELLGSRNDISRLTALRVLNKKSQLTDLQAQWVKALLKSRSAEVRREAAGVLIRKDSSDLEAEQVLVEAARYGANWDRIKAFEHLQAAITDERLVHFADALGDSEFSIRHVGERLFKTYLHDDGTAKPLPDSVVMRMFQSAERVRMGGDEPASTKLRAFAAQWDPHSQLRAAALKAPLPEIDKTVGSFCNRWWKTLRGR